MNGGEIFAVRLRAWRRGKRLPLKAIASAVKVSEATVSGWEHAKRFPSGAHLDAISAFTGMPIRCLFCAEASACARVNGSCRE